DACSGKLARVSGGGIRWRLHGPCRSGGDRCRNGGIGRGTAGDSAVDAETAGGCADRRPPALLSGSGSYSRLAVAAKREQALQVQQSAGGWIGHRSTAAPCATDIAGPAAQDVRVGPAQHTFGIAGSTNARIRDYP